MLEALDVEPATNLIDGLSPQFLGEIYYKMLLTRAFEEAAWQQYGLGKVHGTMHLCVGQEGVGIGAISTLHPDDYIVSTHRGHAHAIGKGQDVREMMAELLGKETGVCRGRGGSMHMADVEKNFWGGHAIVGAHIPIAAGMALGDVYLGKDDAVTICVFGDGASNIGFFHEGLNLSKVWNLPVLWVCENNQYGMGTAVDRASAVSEIRLKAESYGMRNERIDGMDVMTVRKEAAKILESIRKGDGPYLLEIMTYRYRGHSMGDPERYREKDEVRKWEEEDPIGIFRKYLIEKGFRFIKFIV